MPSIATGKRRGAIRSGSELSPLLPLRWPAAAWRLPATLRRGIRLHCAHMPVRPGTSRSRSCCSTAGRRCVSCVGRPTGGQARPDGPHRDRPLRRRQSAAALRSCAAAAARRRRVHRTRDPTAGERDVETVRFADPPMPPVTIVRDRGAGLVRTYTDLFGPADGGELDRVAFAVDGVESGHGSRSGRCGGPTLGRAAGADAGQRRRGARRRRRRPLRSAAEPAARPRLSGADVPSATATGPTRSPPTIGARTNLDTWIAGGRDPARLPPGVAWYIARALRDAVISTAAGW